MLQVRLLRCKIFAILLGISTAQYLTNGTFSIAGPSNVRYDTGMFGPDVEEYHYFYDQWRYKHFSHLMYAC